MISRPKCRSRLPGSTIRTLLDTAIPLRTTCFQSIHMNPFAPLHVPRCSPSSTAPVPFIPFSIQPHHRPALPPRIPCISSLPTRLSCRICFPAHAAKDERAIFLASANLSANLRAPTRFLVSSRVLVWMLCPPSFIGSSSADALPLAVPCAVLRAIFISVVPAFDVHSRPPPQVITHSLASNTPSPLFQSHFLSRRTSPPPAQLLHAIAPRTPLPSSLTSQEGQRQSAPPRFLVRVPIVPILRMEFHPHSLHVSSYGHWILKLRSFRAHVAFDTVPLASMRLHAVFPRSLTSSRQGKAETQTDGIRGSRFAVSRKAAAATSENDTGSDGDWERVEGERTRATPLHPQLPGAPGTQLHTGDAVRMSLDVRFIVRRAAAGDNVRRLRLTRRWDAANVP
ncbi:hypothetical protein B0H19DRAFT_1256196 [Mycena capillaripes]|nr:hypothetical protein B0H19DRAFT_1256196 [Mycena capillaripes]